MSNNDKKPIFSYSTASDPFMERIVDRMCARVKTLPTNLPPLEERDWGEARYEDYKLLKRLGNGTFGEVDLMEENRTGRKVALKRFITSENDFGVPLTAIREMKLLSNLSHPNILEVKNFVYYKSEDKFERPHLYMVTPYMDHDLNGLILNKTISMSLAQIKCYVQQLLQGMEFLHQNNILHRDIKPANLLINNSGCLKVADFGLSRSESYKGKGYTMGVVTTWYRCPELLLGYTKYNEAVDMWSVGCVIAEMLLMKPLFYSDGSDLDQITAIFDLCGSPDETNMPCITELADKNNLKGIKKSSRRIKDYLSSYDPMLVDLIDKLVTLDPVTRITAAQALEHPVFKTEPLPIVPREIPNLPSSHDYFHRDGANGYRRHEDSPKRVPNEVSVRPNGGTPNYFNRIRNRHSGQRHPAGRPGNSPPRRHFRGEDNYRPHHNRDGHRGDRRGNRNPRGAQHYEPPPLRSPNPAHRPSPGSRPSSSLQASKPPSVVGNDLTAANEVPSTMERLTSETNRADNPRRDHGRPSYRDEGREGGFDRYRDYDSNLRGGRYPRDGRNPEPRRGRYDHRGYNRNSRERSPTRYPRESREPYRHRNENFDPHHLPRANADPHAVVANGGEGGYRNDYSNYNRERNYNRSYGRGGRDERNVAGRNDLELNSRPSRYPEDDRNRDFSRPSYPPRPNERSATELGSNSYAHNYHRDNPEYFDLDNEWEQGQVPEPEQFSQPKLNGSNPLPHHTSDHEPYP